MNISCSRLHRFCVSSGLATRVTLTSDTVEVYYTGWTRFWFNLCIVSRDRFGVKF
jgi:hypothetical protein